MPGAMPHSWTQLRKPHRPKRLSLTGGHDWLSVFLEHLQGGQISCGHFLLRFDKGQGDLSSRVHKSIRQNVVHNEWLEHVEV